MVVCFVAHRTIVLILRAAGAHTPSMRTSHGLTQYWQTTYAVGYLSILTSIVVLLRAMLVNATQPQAMVGVDNSSSSVTVQLAHSRDQSGAYDGTDRDRKNLRLLYRIISVQLTMLSYLPLALGIVQGIQYTSAETNASSAKSVQALRYVFLHSCPRNDTDNFVILIRYATTGIALAATVVVQGLAAWAYVREPLVRRSALLFLIAVSALLIVPSVYRLNVMRFKTPSLTALGPGTLNDPGSKATFYVFHIVPELLAAMLMFVVDVRGLCDAGPWGDWYQMNKKSKSAEERTEGEVESAQKHAAKDDVRVQQTAV